MKKFILLFILFNLNNCTSQTKDSTINNKSVKTKKHIMEYFDINKYNTLDTDPMYSNSKDDSHYIIEDEKIRILHYSNRFIKVEKTSKNHPYTEVKVFYKKTKSLKYTGKLLYHFQIDIWQEFDEEGRLIKEKNWNLPYKFSIEDLKIKMQKEYDINIMDTKKTFNLSRYVYDKENIPLYEIMLNTDIPYSYKEYLIDGNTGKVLFTKATNRDDELGILEHFFKNKKIDKSEGTKKGFWNNLFGN